MNKKSSMIMNATAVVRSAYKVPDFDLMSRMMGIDPNISIIANKTMKEANISTKLRCMIRNVEGYHLNMQI
jgi:hypothetical protein